MRPNLDSLMATYTSKPVYYVQYSNKGCLVDIRINDAMVEKVGEPLSTGGAVITANPCIRKSGRQTVTVRLTPHRNKSMITAEKPFTLKIGYKDFMKKSGDRPWHWVLEMPPIIMPKEGLPYYEWSGEFEAVVPYNIMGGWMDWTTCIDLRKIPDIKQRVVAKFNEMRQLIIGKKYAEIRRIEYPKYYELSIMLYENEKDIDKLFATNERDYDEQDPLYYEPIEPCTLVFYADGRMVTLEKYYEDLDFWFPSGLVWIKKDEEGYSDYTNYCLQYGIRKGTNELVLIG